MKLLKYLKKSVVPILTVFLLLAVQAACDLSLPAYTSNIVNVGIQQHGIENAVPHVVRESQMKKLTLFMSAEDQKTVLSGYTHISRETLSAEEFSEKSAKYPALENEALYELNTKDKDTLSALDAILGKPLLIVGMMESDNEQIAAMKAQLAANLPPQAASGNVDFFQLLSAMPESQRGQILAAMEEKFDAMQPSIISQSAVSVIQEEYSAVGINTEKMQNNYVLLSGAKMLGLTIVSMMATIMVGFLSSKIAASLGRDLRRGVFHKVLSFSNTEMDQFSTASLITRSTNDIQQVQMLIVMLLRVVFYAPIMGVGGIFKVLNTNTSMSWIIAMAVGVILTIVIVLFSIVMPRFKMMQKLIDRVNLVTREILTGLPVIRAFSTERHEEARFDKANTDLTKTNLFVNRVMTCMMPLMMFVMNGVSVLIVWNGSKGIDAGQMQVGDMMAFIQYTMQIIMAFLMISMVSIMLPRAAASMDRIDEVMKTDPSITDPEHSAVTPACPEKTGYVEFRNVSFRYPNAEEDVLSNITFTAKPGETTAFIGSTGSGKSTLINLIPRFYDVTQGELLVDGTDVRSISQHDLHDKIGYVPQKGVLFSGTVESNLKYGRREATEEEIKKAAVIAQATEFIESKEDGYAAEIAQGGTNVSGGQKQRLSIARAIASKPEIYIFDDSFSALDYKTDVALRKALKNETAESTVLIVAQRISTIAHADQIIVLDEGHIVGKGTHKELLETCEVYNQIAQSQLSKEELANG